jgi:hypothetical protein
LPLYRIRLHTGKIISQEDLSWDVENALGYDPGDYGFGPRPPIGSEPATPSS